MNVNKVENRNVFECIEMDEIKKITTYEENSDDNIIFDDLSEYSPSIISNNDNIIEEKKILDDKLLKSMINSENLLKNNQFNWYDNLDIEDYKDNSIIIDNASKLNNIILQPSTVSMNPKNIIDNNIFLTNKESNTFEINNINLKQQNSLINMNTININNDNYEHNVSEDICDTTKSDNSFLDIDQDNNKIKITQQEIKVLKGNHSEKKYSSRQSTNNHNDESTKVQNNQNIEISQNIEINQNIINNQNIEINQNIKNNQNIENNQNIKNNQNISLNHMDEEKKNVDDDSFNVPLDINITQPFPLTCNQNDESAFKRMHSKNNIVKKKNHDNEDGIQNENINTQKEDIGGIKDKFNLLNKLKTKQKNREYSNSSLSSLSDAVTNNKTLKHFSTSSYNKIKSKKSKNFINNKDSDLSFIDKKGKEKNKYNTSEDEICDNSKDVYDNNSQNVSNEEQNNMKNIISKIEESVHKKKKKKKKINQTNNNNNDNMDEGLNENNPSEDQYSSEDTLKDNMNPHYDNVNMILTSNQYNDCSKINYNNFNSNESDHVNPIEGDIMNNFMSLSTRINNNDKKKLTRSSMSSSLKTYNSYNFKNVTCINNSDKNLNSFLKKKMHTTGNMYDIKVPIKKYFQGLKKINNLLSKDNNNNNNKNNDFGSDENINDYINDDEKEVDDSEPIVNNNDDYKNNDNHVNKKSMENINKMNNENIIHDQNNIMYLRQKDSNNTSFDNYWDVDNINKRGPFPSSKLSAFLNENVNVNNDDVNNVGCNNIQYSDNKENNKENNKELNNYVMEENYLVETSTHNKRNNIINTPCENPINLNTNEYYLSNNIKDDIEVSINKNTNKNIINLYENNFKRISQCPLEEKRINHVFKTFLNNEDLDMHINKNTDNKEETQKIKEIKDIIMKYANNSSYYKDGDLASDHVNNNDHNNYNDNNFFVENITPEERNKINEFLKKHNDPYNIEKSTRIINQGEGKLKVNLTGDINVQKGGDSINSPGSNRNKDDTNNSGNNNNNNKNKNNINDSTNSSSNNNRNNNDDGNDDDDDDNNNNNNRNNNNLSSANNINEITSKVKRRIIDCRNNRLDWGATQVIIDIDDTIRSSGGYKFFNYNLGGVDAQYQRGETYPGSFQFIFELAMNKLAAEAKPLLLSVLTARIPQVPITEDSYLNKKFNEVAERRGIKHWGIDCENKILYSTLKEWVWNETRGEKKFFNFKQLHKYVIQQNSLVRYIWIGDTGDMDRQAGELMIKTFPQRIKAVFLHHVKGKDDNTLLPSDYFIKSVPIFFFRTYIGAATKAHAYNLIDKKGLTRVLVQAVLDLEKSKVPADSSKWEDLIKDIILSDALDELDKYNAETVNRTKRIIAQKMKEISERKLHFIS
ncbi:conserved Plasmodium protein, unknown function [Plasmodium sp. DRC-Itaito]|nr:conserved Plasmodium protein, unknown function [Plasmodium sp. DRC-Itaito]